MNPSQLHQHICNPINNSFDDLESEEYQEFVKEVEEKSF